MKAKDRELLRAHLLEYLEGWDSAISTRTLFYRFNHRGDSPNSVMVPNRFFAVSGETEYRGLKIITPMFTSDESLELPYVCFAAPTERYAG